MKPPQIPEGLAAVGQLTCLTQLSHEASLALFAPQLLAVGPPSEPASILPAAASSAPAVQPGNKSANNAKRGPWGSAAVRAAADFTTQADARPTTVVMRNLPNNYKRSSLLDLLDSSGFAAKYDFLYFPVDFRTHATLGYAFVNLVTPEDAEQFKKHFNGFNKWCVHSRKVCNVGWSQPHQGLAAHIARFQNSPLMHESVPDIYRPALFRNGVRIQFPPPTKKIKPPRQGFERMLV